MAVTTEKQEVFAFLVALRDSGVTNMYGAIPYIIEEYPHLSRKEATAYFVSWTKTFKE